MFYIFIHRKLLKTMDKGTKTQLIQMQSLMERMDKHYTKDQADSHVKSKLIKEGLEELDASNRQDVDTNDFFDMVTRMKGGTRASFGYVSAADLDLPKIQKRNPDTNRMKNYPDWATFGKNIGEENEITGVIKLGMYTLNWRSPHNMAKHYNQNYVTPVNALRDKYGVEHIQKREVPAITTNDYGISAYNGSKEELNGHTYSQQDLKTANTKKEIHYFLIGAEGNILKEVSFEQLKPYIKQKGPDGIRAFKQLVTDGKATEEEALQMFKEYAAELGKINVKYQQFIHERILYIITSVNGEKKRFFNGKLASNIGDVQINPQEFINLAKKYYNIADEQVQSSDLGEFDDDIPEEV